MSNELRDAIHDHAANSRDARSGGKRRKRNLQREPYTPGIYDKFLAPRTWEPSERLRGLTFEPDQEDGASLLVIEHTRDGRNPAHHVECWTSGTISLELVLGNGALALVDIMMVAPVAGGDTVQADGQEHSAPAALLEFGDGDDL